MGWECSSAAPSSCEPVMARRVRAIVLAAPAMAGAYFVSVLALLGVRPAMRCIESPIW